MVTNLYIEYRDSKVLEKKVVEKVKEFWKAEGKKIKDITKIDLYYKSEEGMCYFVVNGAFKGSFALVDL